MRDILARQNREVLTQFAWSEVLVAFDYDGTLAPIVDDPGEARMRPGTRELLQEAARLYPVVVISGRAQPDVMRWLRGVGVRGIIGNHGIEPWPESERFIGEVQRWRPVLERELAGLSGVWIEDKVFSLAVHYRKSRSKKEARAAILEAAGRLGDLRAIGGKDVVNLLPSGAPHKGIALEKARERLFCDTAIYVGDDDTDEDVFSLDQPGRLLSIRVGVDAASRASYYLEDQPGIDGLLRELVALCPKAGKGEGGRRKYSGGAVLGAADSPPLGEVLDFMRLIWAVDHALQRTSKRMAATLGVTGPQRLVIRIVGKYPGLPAGHLARLLHLHPSTLTGILKRLERQGLIRRRADPRDARRLLLGLTDKGRAFEAGTEGTVEAAVQRALASADKARLLAAREVLDSIARALEHSASASSSKKSGHHVRRRSR